MTWEQASADRRDAHAVIEERLAYLEERAEHGKISDEEWRSLQVLRRKMNTR